MRTPASPPETGQQASFDSVFAREAFLAMEARHRQVIPNRWAVIGLAFALALAGRYAGILPISYTVAFALALVQFVINLVFLLLLRQGAFRPWQF